MSLLKDPLEVTRERRRVIKAAAIQKRMASGSPSAMPGPKSQDRTIASDGSGADRREAQFESPPSKPKKDWSRSCSPGTRSEKDLHPLDSTSNETATKDPFVESSGSFDQNRWREPDLPSTGGPAFAQTQGCLEHRWVVQADIGLDGANQTWMSRGRTFSRRFSRVTPAPSYPRQSWPEVLKDSRGEESDQMNGGAEEFHFVDQGSICDASIASQQCFKQAGALTQAKKQTAEELFVRGVLI